MVDMTLLKSDAGALDPGDKAPDFKLKNVDTKLYGLSSLKGKTGTAIIFTCNHCPYAIPKFQEIAELQSEFETKGIAVICICSNDPEVAPEDDFPSMKRKAQELGLRYYLWDESQMVAKSYGAVCTPDAFVFNKDLKLVYHGRINNAMNLGEVATKHDVREVFEALVEKKDIIEWFRYSMGCSIKWKQIEEMKS
jgi:peroxiredoxin